jgi:protein O-GlcNAc transferase
MDWWLTDPFLHPEDTTELAVERFLRIPSLYLHRPPEGVPDPGPPPQLKTGRTTFASFSNPAKLNDVVLALWARILRSVPGARLQLGYFGGLADADGSARIRRRFVDLGVSEERLSFAGKVPDRVSHLMRVAEVDVALDPFPFNGGTSTFEALWMGVPVVTLAGRRFAGRGGVTHLFNAGLPELVAVDEDGYVEIALKLAASGRRLSDWRRSLRDRIKLSPLCRADDYARSVEDAYRYAWSEWCRGRGSHGPR